MADNKVVNTTQLEADLTSIADGIRAKAESSDSLVFPSGFVDAIANIVTGGGLPSGFSAFASGTFTPTSALTGNQSIEHGLGVTPNFFYLIALGNMNVSNTSYVISQQCFLKTWTYNSTICYGFRLTHYRNSYGNMQHYAEALTSSYLQNNCLNDTTFSIYGGSDYPIRGGTSHLWICGVIDGL